MFVFGATVSDNFAGRESNKKVTARKSSNSTKKSKRNQQRRTREDLSKLEKEEKELIEKLEATRKRIKQRIETKDHHSEHDGQIPNSAGSLAFFQALVPRDASQVLAIAAKAKQPLDQPNTLPILTRDAQPAFQVGLEEEKTHMLPIFHLPPVSKSSHILNPLPKDASDEEKKRLLQEQETKARVQAALGLTDEEIKLFDRAMGSRGKSPLAQVQNDLSPKEIPPPSPKQLMKSLNNRPTSGDPRTPSSPYSAAPFATMSPSGGVKSRVAKAVPTVFPQVLLHKPGGSIKRRRQIGRKRGRGKGPQEGSSLSLALRKELASSINNLQFLTEAMQQELSELHKEYPLTSLKAKEYIQKWGIKKLEALFAGREKRKLASAFQTWVAYTAEQELWEKQTRYLRVQAVAKISSVTQSVQKRQQTRAFQTWFRFYRFEKDNEEYLRWSRACLAVQRVFRGYKGRKRAKRKQRELEQQEQARAATKLQSLFRGRKAREGVETLRELQILNHAARRIQANFRVRLAKKTVHNKRQQRVLENKAALRIQTRWRCKKGQMSYHLLRQARREEAARKMQAIQRRRAAQKRATVVQAKRRRERAAICIQRQYRVRIAMRRMEARRKAVQVQRDKEERAARKLQAIYRGHRGRIIYMLKEQVKSAQTEHESQQVQKIQAVFRGKLGRKKANKRKKEYLEEMCSWARCWMETFDETTQQWVFINTYTQEVLLEPPPDGYTKKDGLLALLDGRVMEDPLVAEQREREKNLLRCVECEQIAATRKCNECEDIFCEDCYESIHLKGKLSTHTFEWFQNGAPPLAQPYATAQQSDQYHQQHQEEYSTDQFSGFLTEQPSGTDEWMQLFDESSQLPYWYNTATQETQWENPYQAQSLTHQAPDGFQVQQDEQEEWEEAFDDIGNRYFVGRKSRMSVWELPAGAKLVDPFSSLNDSVPLDEWQQFFDENGTPYYYNATTGETRWSLDA